MLCQMTPPLSVSRPEPRKPLSPPGAKDVGYRAHGHNALSAVHDPRVADLHWMLLTRRSATPPMAMSRSMKLGWSRNGNDGNDGSLGPSSHTTTATPLRMAAITTRR